jgi:hypothetical protein
MCGFSGSFEATRVNFWAKNRFIHADVSSRMADVSRLADWEFVPGWFADFFIFEGQVCPKIFVTWESWFCPRNF